MLKQSIKKNAAFSFAQRVCSSAKRAFVRSVIRLFYGEHMHMTVHTPTPIAGAVVFWYMENNVRHYIFVKEEGAPHLRFPSCLGLGKFNTISAALAHVGTDLLGSAFIRSLDKNVLASDRISSVPVFSYKEKALEASYPVHTLLWTVQITPDQAQLCQPQRKNTYIIATPEVGLASVNIAPSHVTLVKEAQKVLRKHQRQFPEVDLSSDVLEDILTQTTPANRTIH